MSFTEDLAPFFADFGIAATVGGVSVRGIFDNLYAVTLGFAAGTTPQLVVASASIPLVAQDDAVVIATISYTVTAVEPDGTGMTLLRLDRAT